MSEPLSGLCAWWWNTNKCNVFWWETDWTWQAREGWEKRSSWSRARSLLHRAAIYFKALQRSVEPTRLCNTWGMYANHRCSALISGTTFAVSAYRQKYTHAFLSATTQKIISHILPIFKSLFSFQSPVEKLCNINYATKIINIQKTAHFSPLLMAPCKKRSSVSASCCFVVPSIYMKKGTKLPQGGPTGQREHLAGGVVTD